MLFISPKMRSSWRAGKLRSTALVMFAPRRSDRHFASSHCTLLSGLASWYEGHGSLAWFPYHHAQAGRSGWLTHSCRIDPRISTGSGCLSPTRKVGPALVISGEDPRFEGKFNGHTHMGMLGSTALAEFDVFLDWAEKNIPIPS
jgi:hypothetical protein